MRWDECDTRKFEMPRLEYPDYYPKATTPTEIENIFKRLNTSCFNDYLSPVRFYVASLRYAGMLGYYKAARFDRRSKMAKIAIDQEQKGLDLVETVFHEMIHHFQEEAGWVDDNSPHDSLFHDDYNKRIGIVKSLYEPKQKTTIVLQSSLLEQRLLCP